MVLDAPHIIMEALPWVRDGHGCGVATDKKHSQYLERVCHLLHVIE